jgi:hypothetical protein
MHARQSDKAVQSLYGYRLHARIPEKRRFWLLSHLSKHVLDDPLVQERLAHSLLATNRTN